MESLQFAHLRLTFYEKKIFISLFYSYLAIDVTLMFDIVHLLFERCSWNSFPIWVNADLSEFGVKVSIDFFPHFILVSF